jgi:hypothetical protein
MPAFEPSSALTETEDRDRNRIFLDPAAYLFVLTT